jgi:xylan 1,4-beta-xylosidase
MNQLGEQEVRTGDTQSWVTRDDKGVKVLAWDFQTPDMGDKTNRPFFGAVQPTRNSKPLKIQLKGMKPGTYAVQIYRTGFKANDAHTAYLEMGKPKTLSSDQLAQLQAQTQDKPETKSVKVGANGTATVQVPMRANDVVLVKIAK